MKKCMLKSDTPYPELTRGIGQCDTFSLKEESRRSRKRIRERGKRIRERGRRITLIVIKKRY